MYKKNISHQLFPTIPCTKLFTKTQPIKTLKLIYLHTTKALSRSNLNKEFQIGCEKTEIELKKNSPFGFGSPGRRFHYYRIYSRATILELFVKKYRSLGRSRLLVRYFIPQS